MAKAKAKPPLLEWIASAIGLLLALGLLAAIARDGLSGRGEALPDISVAAVRAQPVGAGWVVEFEARNAAPATAALVMVEGRLPDGETSSATIDYVPGRSARRGGLFFSREPRGLRLRALGYQDP